MHQDEVTQLLMLCHFDTCNSMHMIFGHNIDKGFFVNIEYEFGAGNQPPVYCELPKFVPFLIAHPVNQTKITKSLNVKFEHFSFLGERSRNEIVFLASKRSISFPTLNNVIVALSFRTNF